MQEWMLHSPCGYTFAMSISFAHYIPEAAEEKEKICDWVKGLGGVWGNAHGADQCLKGICGDGGDSSTASNADTLSDESDSDTNLRRRCDPHVQTADGCQEEIN